MFAYYLGINCYYTYCPSDGYTREPMDEIHTAKPTGSYMAYLNMLPATQVGFIKNLIRVPRRIVKGFVRCIGRTRDLLKNAV